MRVCRVSGQKKLLFLIGDCGGWVHGHGLWLSMMTITGSLCGDGFWGHGFTVVELLSWVDCGGRKQTQPV